MGLARAAHRRVGAYSLGMRQRLGLAAALLGDPPVLILDEPGNGLDPQGIRWLRDLLRERAAAGDTVFVSSHLLDEVEHLADDLVVINHGRLVTTGELATLKQAGATVRTPEPERLARLLTDAGALVHPDSEGELVVRAIETSRIGDLACSAGISLHELTPEADSLEDLFMEWTSNDNSHLGAHLRCCGQDRKAGSTAMTWLRLVRAEIRKLTTTKLPWGFLAVLVVIAGIDAAVVVFGTDMDGTKGFIATAADQQSLMAFAFNAMLGTAFFGAIAVAREYGHHTVVPTFLISPKRARATLAQLTAVLVGGALLGLIGQALIIARVALALPTTSFGFLVPAGDVARLLAASTFAGAVGAILGAGLGAVIRNLGGAVTAAVLMLFMIPPLVVQLVSDAASWIPPALGTAISGVTTDVNTWAAAAVLLAWGLVPAVVGLIVVQRRDVV